MGGRLCPRGAASERTTRLVPTGNARTRRVRGGTITVSRASHTTSQEENYLKRIGLVSLAFLVTVVVAGLLWPVNCLILPSLPAQGPYCTSMLGLPTTMPGAMAGGLLAGAIAALLASRLVRYGTRSKP